MFAALRNLLRRIAAASLLAAGLIRGSTELLLHDRPEGDVAGIHVEATTVVHHADHCVADVSPIDQVSSHTRPARPDTEPVVRVTSAAVPLLLLDRRPTSPPGCRAPPVVLG